MKTLVGKKKKKKTEASLYFIFARFVAHFSKLLFEAIFYLDRGFLSISYTRAKKVVFRHLLTRESYHILKGNIKGIYILF